jgi:hypothetical protein
LHHDLFHPPASPGERQTDDLFSVRSQKFESIGARRVLASVTNPPDAFAQTLDEYADMTGTDLELREKFYSRDRGELAAEKAVWRRLPPAAGGWFHSTWGVTVWRRWK